MRNNFDKFLLGLLWLMTVALATTFWMNIRYGFDIFSGAHWEYLSGLQADRAIIKPEFYISLIFAIGIALIGLYAIVRPRFRKVPMPQSQSVPAAPTAPTPVAPTMNNNFVGMQRPKSPVSLNAKMARRQTQEQLTPPTQRVPVQAAPKPMVPTPSIPQTPSANPLAKDINAILESVKYIMKPCKRIGKLNNPIVALGYDQTLWIATSNVDSTDMVDAIQTLVGVFDDTLGDSANDITPHGCIIGPKGESNNDLISTFATINDFKQYMNEHQNTMSADFDKELFDAISTYISTVTNYIGKE